MSLLVIKKGYWATLHFFFLDVLLSSSKWNHMHWSGDRATLTLTHLNKEDEGLYTLRVTTKSGYETYSAYVFVRGGYTFPLIYSYPNLYKDAVHKISYFGRLQSFCYVLYSVDPVDPPPYISHNTTNVYSICLGI